MFTIREWKIIGVMFVMMMVLTIVLLNYGGDNKEQLQAQQEAQAKQAQEAIEGRVTLMKELAGSPMAIKTREAFNYLANATSSERQALLSSPEFSTVKDLLTIEKMSSKFISVNGSMIEGAGGRIFILFPQYPDYVYRVTIRQVNSTTSPFVIASIEKAEDTQEVIKNYLETYKSYLNNDELYR